MEGPGRYQLSASLNEVYIPGSSTLPGLALLLSFHGQALRLTVRSQLVPTGGACDAEDERDKGGGCDEV